MKPEEESLYADMRAAIRGDRERAEKRAEKKGSIPVSTPPSNPPRHRRFAGMSRLFGGPRDPA
jgi:hypothetical protein